MWGLRVTCNLARRLSPSERARVPPAPPDRALTMLTMWETGLVFILGLAAPFLVRLATSFCQKRELYGSEAVLLNLEVQSLWNNMGYWEGPQGTAKNCR